MAERGDRLHGQDVASSESLPTTSEEKKLSVKGTSKSKKGKWKQQQRWRKKRLAHDVKTDQDGDARAACEDEVDTFDDVGFVMVNLQDEFEELKLDAANEGVGSARVAAVDPKEGEKQVKRRNPSKRTMKKKEKGRYKDVAVVLNQEAEMNGEKEEVVQTRQLLETVEREEVESVLIVGEKQSKKQKQQKNDGAGKGSRGSRKAGKLTLKEKKQEVLKRSAKKEMNVHNAGTAEKKGRVRQTTQRVQQVEGDEVMSLQKEIGSSTKLTSKSRKNVREHGQVTYAEYLDHDVVIRGLEMGSLLQGKLRVNPMYRTDGYVSVDGLSVDVLVKGMEDRNRAFDGDLVAVRLHPESAWKPLAIDCGRNAADQAASKFMSSDAGLDQNALRSLWLPNVQVDQCFQTRMPESETSVDMLKQTMARLNERVVDSCKRPTASVVFILAQGNANGFVGSLKAKTRVKDMSSPLSSNDNYAYFYADDPRLPRHIQIPRLQLPDEFVSRPMQYSKSMLCCCRIKAWSTKHQSPMGEFVKTVGEYTGIETGISAILFQHGLQAHTLDFDSSILNELDDKYGTSGEKWEIPNEELQSRRDFRDTQIFSIDPYNARDLDDALHIRALDDAHTKFEIGVHIADVTHFIEHNSLLDLEARLRATSVYLANRVLPMLPRILCEKLCSLQPQVDRLAFSVVWQMNLDGTLVDGVEPWFGKSVIRSCCKLDYGSAQMMLDGAITEENADKWEEDRRPVVGANSNITAATVIQSVKDLWSIGENRRVMRFETGAVSLNDVKLVFSLDAKGNPTRYGSYEVKNSNRLVEEYMLLANYLVAQQLLRAHGPLAFLRHHPPPVSRSLDQTLEQLNKSDIDLDGRSSKQLAESLDRIRQDRGEVTFAVVQALIIKPMKPAEYMVAGNGASPDSWRHYALNIPYYTHFTSPIRRYADVVVHRLLQESCVTGASSFSDDAFECADAISRMAEYTSVAQNCNEKKMTSKKAETECDKVFLCAFVHHHGDIEVTGVVLSTGQKGFTVYILELGLEQRLFLRDMRLVGSWNGKKLQLSIRLLAGSRLVQEKQESRVESSNEDATDTNAKQNASEMVTLTFMKQLRMRMSTTKKMPLSLTFSVIAEKTS